jgi:hypothetical protein
MNDLAEKALHGLDVARRRVGDRPMLSLSVAGFLLSCVIVVAGGEVGAARATRPLASWLGLQDTHAVQSSDPVPGTVMLAGTVALLLLWLLTVEVVRRSAQPQRRVWWLAAAWGTPFALGPPLMDTTAYSYAAFGLLQRQGHDPYDSGPGILGSRAVVAAIDPGARGTPSAAGPLGTLAQHIGVSVGGGSALGAVIVLRVIGVFAAVAIGRLAVELAGVQPARALTTTTANPLVLLYVVSAAHLDGAMIALVLAALVAANQRRWLRSVVLAVLAGSVSGPGFLVVPAIIGAHWLGRRRISSWLLVGRDLVVAAATFAATGLIVGNGFGWLSTVHKQFSAHTPFSVAGALAKLMAPIVRGASYDDLAAGARITVLTLLVCTVGYLLGSARRRAVERTAGYSLLALGLLAPVLFPWYLLWGLLCLAPSAVGSRRIGVLALSTAGCLLVPPGFGPTTANIITGVALTAVAAVTIMALRRQAVAEAERPMVSAAG